MKIDKNILIMSKFPQRVVEHFDETFNTFKLYEETDRLVWIQVKVTNSESLSSGL